ncbi:MAG: DUF402 domain-containing protein [Lachnospiraceae bacterium]|nr:DUF402 domain-containing protein [Lachnospiraceae bacterium]
MDPFLIRRVRLIPQESILLKDDVILYRDDEQIITSWDAFRKRPELVRGLSVYYLKEHLKLSKVFHEDHDFHWYIDLADYYFTEDGKELVMTDLLADVAITRDGKIRVLDLGELADAHSEGLISDALLKKSLYTLDRLLRELYQDGVARLAAPLEEYS